MNKQKVNSVIILTALLFIGIGIAIGFIIGSLTSEKINSRNAEFYYKAGYEEGKETGRIIIAYQEERIDYLKNKLYKLEEVKK